MLFYPLTMIKLLSGGYEKERAGPEGQKIVEIFGLPAGRR
jgi:hypothetical protein